MSQVRRTLTTDFEYGSRSSGFDPFTVRRVQLWNVEELSMSLDHYPINTRIDDGGPFLVHKTKDRSTSGYVPWNYYGGYYGQVLVGSPVGSWVTKTAVGLADSALNALGSTAIARTAPTNPAFDMSTALGELVSDGLPMISGMQTIKNRAAVARSAGGEYLNVQFGWLPLLSDVRSFAHAVKNSGKILEAYRKGSDKKIRRRYHFPDNVRENRLYSGGFFPDVQTNGTFFDSGTMSELYTKETWFSGAFRYHIPTSDSQLGKFQRWLSYADHLLGVKVTPETLWNIAPWSWAVDWFTNTGDVMTNIANLGRDGLVLQYGYIMHSTKVETDTTAYINLSGTRVQCHRTRSEEWKMRLPATPYGFGVDLKALTAKQVSVIAALGLSRT